MPLGTHAMALASVRDFLLVWFVAQSPINSMAATAQCYRCRSDFRPLQHAHLMAQAGSNVNRDRKAARKPARPCFKVAQAVLMPAALVVCAATASPPAQADGAPGVVIVLDGSGSMWGKMDADGIAKFYGARDVLRDHLGRAPEHARVGFASFGHRRKGDCSDAEVIAPLEAGGTPRVVEALDKLNPRGKGPVSLGLREAARSFRQGERGHIVLIHDNADNCQQDACAAATEIAASAPDLAIHVLGLGLPEGEQARMQCVADITRGRSYAITDRAGLDAAITEIFALAALTPDAAPPPVSALPRPANDDQLKGAPGLRLTAALAEGAAMLNAPISWTIRKAGASAEEVPIVQRASPEINEALPLGRYSVDVSHGLVTRSAEFEVTGGGPTLARIALDAGVIAFAASATSFGDALDAPFVTLAPSGDDLNGTGAPLWIGRQGSGELVVPTGTYSLVVTDGLARGSAQITVTAGQTARSKVVLETGRLELQAPAEQNGLPLGDITYMIEVDDVEAPQGRREIARSTAPAAGFTLQAGTYYVSAVRGSAQVRERIAVSSGDIVKRTLVPDGARVLVRPEITGASVPSEIPVITRVRREDSGGSVGYSTSSEPSFILGSGRYRIESRLGTTNVRSSTTIEVAGNKDMAATLALQAVEVEIAASDEGVSDSVMRAVVRDAKGRTVWRSRPGRPMRALLAPGDYTVQTERAGTLIERKISVGAGDKVVVPRAPPG